jgi:hypothetical protein
MSRVSIDIAPILGMSDHAASYPKQKTISIARVSTIMAVPSGRVGGTLLEVPVIASSGDKTAFREVEAE